MKIKTLILTLFFFSGFFFFASLQNVIAKAPVCTFPRGGFPFAGFGAVCLGPVDYSDAIRDIGSGSNFGICQVLQDDTGRGNGVYTYRSRSPRNVMCSLTETVSVNNGTTDSCSCSDGSACKDDGNPNNGVGDISNLYSVIPWNFAECSKCVNSSFQSTWVQSQGSVTVSVSADNWRPILHRECVANCNSQTTDPTWDSYVDFPQSWLDFKFQVLESGNTTPIKEVNIFPNAATPTNMNCIYHTVNTRSGVNPSALAFANRDPLNNYTTCSVSDYQITGIVFNPGKTYTVKTLIKAHYADDTQWMDYVSDGTSTGKDYNICNSSLTIPNITLTPTPTGMPACEGLNVNNLTPNLGETVSFTCVKNASYAGTVSYDFRSIHKETAGAPPPEPMPTPFAQGSSVSASYQFPEGQYGYYLFQCRVCSGAFCTPWQNPAN
jgi:hypothetical protein